MWSSTVGLVNGKHRYLTAETFGFKVNSNGQQLKRRQQWTIEPFPENAGPDGSISSAASVSSSQCPINGGGGLAPGNSSLAQMAEESNGTSTCIMTLSNGPNAAGLLRHHSNGSSNNGSDHSEALCDEEHENVAIKSHLNKYLAVDSFGNVTCDSDEKTEITRFTITICSMSQGKSKEEHIFWAFKNVERGYYLGTTEDGMICCNAKVPRSRAELWHLHLLPARGASFFALKSLGRKRFARVCPDDQQHAPARPASAQVQLDANISWGPETLFQFKYFDGGRYALLTSDNRYLTNEGKCERPNHEQQLPPSECLFTLEYHSGYLAFRDSQGHYLAAAGRSSVLRSRSIGVSRDELFMFEGVPVQVSLKATFNQRWVSIKQGIDVSANQTDTSSEFETFQLTHHKQTQLWSIMTQECNFWTVSKSTNTVCVCRPADYEALARGQFRLVWSENEATFSLKFADHLASADRWIVARKSGQLFAASPSASAAGQASAKPVKFIMRLQSRRLLNLRPVDGSAFVGLKSLAGPSKQLEACKTAPDSIQLEYSEPSGASTAPKPSFEGPQVGARAHEQHSGEDCNSKVISMFNVKLNSTKNGQNILGADREATNLGPAQQAAKATTQTSASPDQTVKLNDQKQLDCLTIDSNNNEPFELAETGNGGGGVESAAAPSVASIISTFSSNVRLTGEHQQPTVCCRPATNCTVSKLASTFESNGNKRPTESSSNSSPDFCDANDAEMLTQSECCYMRIALNGKYLQAGPPIGSVEQACAEAGPNLSVICDATNKACAQSWILELRSHNSIAIRTSDTQAYMQLGTNGTIFLSRCEPADASLWEF